MQALLKRKRAGAVLTDQEITDFVAMVTDGRAHDSQIGAMLMAIAINGMTPGETATLTSSMAKSGSAKLSCPGAVMADKHSTGGVGDKVSIPLVPILAELGLTVPMISGRGLELTGGTLDKLDSIPDYKTALSREELERSLAECGCFIAAAENICPADKKLYEIRDVTSTVDCTPLVTASILSKKIAEGARFLIQDIKVGEAAFYKDVESAEELAQSMIRIATLNDLKMAVSLTRMDQPLGRAVGNSLEIQECVEILRGEHRPRDLLEITFELGSQLLMLSKRCSSLEEAKKRMDDTIRDGTALKRFEKMLIHQGVKEQNAKELCYGKPSNVLPQSSYTTEFLIKEDGFIQSINASRIGRACFKLGGGRNIPTDTIDYSVGCELLKFQGDEVQKGISWARLHHNKPLTTEIKELMEKAVNVSPVACTRDSLIIKTIIK